MIKRALLAALPLLTSSSLAVAGETFVVNGYTSGYASFSSIGADAAGNFVIVWQGATPADEGNGIFGRRFDSLGEPVGAEFQVNSYTTGDQTSPAVAVTPDGRFVVAWYDAMQESVLVRRFDSDGSAAGGEFQVNSYTSVAPPVILPFGFFTNTPLPGPSVAVDADGDFMVTWDTGSIFGSCGTGGPCTAVLGRHFDAAGTPAGPEFQISAFTSSYGGEFQPSVASVGDDQFVVVWTLAGGPSAYTVGWDSTRAPLGEAFLVSDLTPAPSSFPVNPVVRGNGSGAFVVAWNEAGGDPDSLFTTVRARRFGAIPAPDSTPTTQSRLVAGPNPFPLADPFALLFYSPFVAPEASMAPDGNFVVTWPTPFSGDGSVEARRYSRKGAPSGEAFVVSPEIGYGLAPAVALNAEDDLLATWTGATPGNPGVLARLITDATPPLVKVTFPNTGGKLLVGLTSDITWTGSDASDGLAKFDVFLSRDGGTSYDPAPICTVFVLAGVSPFSCAWTATAPATAQARIKVVATSNGGATAQDASKGNSTIAEPFVTMKGFDTTGLFLKAGKPSQLQFSHNLGAGKAVLLEINRDYPGGSWEALGGSAGCTATSGAASSTCTWVAAGVTNGETARIRVSSVEAPDVTDTTDASFTIRNRVAVTAPNTAVNWKAGTQKAIKWSHNYALPASFDITLDNDGDLDCDDALIATGVAAGTASAGSYSWTVAGAGAQNRVCVRKSPADPDGNDTSDVAFTITP